MLSGPGPSFECDNRLYAPAVLRAMPSDAEVQILVRVGLQICCQLPLCYTGRVRPSFARGEGGELLLYKDLSSDEVVLKMKATPIRLLFLDVDGVLNKSGSKECGELDSELVTRLLQILNATDS